MAMVPNFSSSTNIFFCKSGARAALALDGSGDTPFDNSMVNPYWGVVPGGSMKDLYDKHRSDGMRILRVTPGSFYQLNKNFDTRLKIFI
jgi:hypothetical protein